MTHVLVVAPSWIGDMVLAQCLFRQLQSQNPPVVIDVLAPDWSRALLNRMPEVHEIIDMPLGHGELGLRKRYQIGRSLRTRPYVHAVVLPNSLKSALVPYWAGIPRRTGYVGELRLGLLNDCRRVDRSCHPMTAQQFVALGLPAGMALPDSLPLPGLRVSARGISRACKQYGLEPGQAPMLALCPGAEYGQSKQWPLDYYGVVARNWLGRGWQVWLFGSASDRTVCEAIVSQTGGRCRNLAGMTNLEEAVDLLSLAGMVLSNDSGLMHVAAALGRPQVAVFGSTDPGKTPPLATDARIEYLGLGCSPCFQRTCPKAHLRCLRDLEPNRIMRTMEALIER